MCEDARERAGEINQDGMRECKQSHTAVAQRTGEHRAISPATALVRLAIAGALARKMVAVPITRQVHIYAVGVDLEGSFLHCCCRFQEITFFRAVDFFLGPHGKRHDCAASIPHRRCIARSARPPQ
jgi:hypothetical protein